MALKRLEKVRGSSREVEALFTVVGSRRAGSMMRIASKERAGTTVGVVYMKDTNGLIATA